MKKTSRSAAFLGVAAALILSACSPLDNREDFANALKNKTEDEVVRYAGKPTDIDRANPGRVTWIYKNRTFDVPTRRTDPETDVIFTPSSDGKLHVAEVQFK